MTQANWAALTSGHDWPDFTRHLMQDEGVSYGRAFNKTALVAAALRATMIHRRDSDTALPEVCGEWDLYPSDIEFSKLSSSTSDVVGGNYWGNWNVALGPLVSEPDRLRLIFSAHGIPVVGQNSIINDQLPRANEPPKPDHGAVTRGAYPDLGNCAFRAEPALAFPAPLILDTIGTDYIFLALAVRLGRAWLHGLSVRHQHAPERSEYSYLHDYWLRRAKQMDFLLVLHELDHVGAAAADYDGERVRLAEATRELDELFEDVEPLRRVHWAAYAEAFRGSALDSATQIADHIRTIEAATQADNNSELAEYGSLLRAWPSISEELVSRLRSFLATANDRAKAPVLPTTSQ